MAAAGKLNSKLPLKVVKFISVCVCVRARMRLLQKFIIFLMARIRLYLKLYYKKIVLLSIRVETQQIFTEFPYSDVLLMLFLPIKQISWLLRANPLVLWINPMIIAHAHSLLDCHLLLIS